MFMDILYDLIQAGLVEKVDDKQWKNTIYIIEQEMK
jgi:hypothetical protein